MRLRKSDTWHRPCRKPSWLKMTRSDRAEGDDVTGSMAGWWIVPLVFVGGGFWTVILF